MLGGAALTLFATVAVVGIQTLGKVDFTDHRNLIIVTTSLALALWVTSYPDVAKAMPTGIDLLFGSGISIGADRRDPAQHRVLPPRHQQGTAGRRRRHRLRSTR